MNIRDIFPRYTALSTSWDGGVKERKKVLNAISMTKGKHNYAESENIIPYMLCGCCDVQYYSVPLVTCKAVDLKNRVR
jgi:hypothetical protein